MFQTRVATMLTAAVTGLVSVTGVADASTEARNRTVEGKRVPEQYIVVLGAKSSLPLATVASQLSEKHGGKVREVWGAALNGFSVRITERQAAKLAADPLVVH